MPFFANSNGRRNKLYIKRILDIAAVLDRKSCFLFGPRQTGKTSLVKHTIEGAVVYNLLDTAVFRQFAAHPGRLREELHRHTGPVVIDEIQRLPELLNEVQLLIDERKLRFLLTGSSARKLRRGAANLLGGRARSRRLHPFSYVELRDDFDLSQALNIGLIPSIYFSDDPKDDLRAYVGDYLKEEVAAEGLTRNIPAFSRFLEVAALCHSQVINYSKIASDAEIGRTTVQNYFEILKDTLVGSEVSPWTKGKKRKSIARSKFYFFDQGVVNALQNVHDIKDKSPLFGGAFESFLFHELTCFNDYVLQGNLNFWRTDAGEEVDFIVGDRLAVEVKAKSNVSDRDLKSLAALAEGKDLKHHIVVSLESRARQVGKVRIMPWKGFLEALWSREFV
jgi:predicted AAA+ superfamily ATPase